MYDIKWIRENPEVFDIGRQRRGLKPLAGELLALDDMRRAAIAKSQEAQERRNALSREIGAAMKAGDTAAAEALKTEVAKLKSERFICGVVERDAATKLEKALREIPNLPLEDVPYGKDEHGNVERPRKDLPKRPDFTFRAKEHFEIGEALGLMDFETAAKISGARFVVNKGALARLERALSQFMLELHTCEHGYTEVNPPILVRDEAMFGTAQLPKFKADQFEARKKYSLDEVEIQAFISALNEQLSEKFADFDLSNDSIGIGQFFRNNAKLIFNELVPPLQASFGEKPFWLIPTAEVPLTNLVREKILDEKELPLRFTACTPCFRAEAGAAGKDTRGMIRQHQFTKVELVSITTPEASLAEHDRMLLCAEEVLKRLKLPYRVVTLCTGDMGFASQKTYDIEVWLPGQGRYREISSVSVCGDFQARRMNARYRPQDGKPRFVHTLNGSGVAVGRALVAVLENYQNADGSVTVPEALRAYMGGIETITKD
jgi:seryl-tRNA synthetase